MSTSEIRNAVAALEERERAELAAWLLDSLPPHKDDEDEGLEEANRRREELNSGLVKPLTSQEFWNSLDREQT